MTSIIENCEEEAFAYVLPQSQKYNDGSFIPPIHMIPRQLCLLNMLICIYRRPYIVH